MRGHSNHYPYAEVSNHFPGETQMDQLDQAYARIVALEEEKAVVLQGYQAVNSDYEWQRLEQDQRQYEEWTYAAQSMQQHMEELAKQNQVLAAVTPASGCLFGCLRVN